MKYTVHLYYAVRIRMDDIEAGSQEEAVTKAAAECDVKTSLASGAFEDDESPHLGATVDEVGDEEYNNTSFHDGDGAQNYLSDASQRMHKAAPALLAALEAIVGPLDKRDRYGYAAACNAMDDGIRSAARLAIAEARGEK